jgi:hypothetical protein
MTTRAVTAVPPAWSAVWAKLGAANTEARTVAERRLKTGFIQTLSSRGVRGWVQAQTTRAASH